jgi:hypothetical protein
MKIILLSLLLLHCLISPANANSVYRSLELQQDFHTKIPWQVSIITKDDSLSLCFTTYHEKQCAPILIPSIKVQYPANEVKPLTVLHDPLLLEVISKFSDNGSGALIKLEYWYYDHPSEHFKTAGHATLTEQSEYRWENGILITADAHMQEGETHFEPHHFEITAYRYASGNLQQVTRYVTRDKYPSFDEVDKIEVIVHELPTIRKQLR